MSTITLDHLVTYLQTEAQKALQDLDPASVPDDRLDQMEATWRALEALVWLPAAPAEIASATVDVALVGRLEGPIARARFLGDLVDALGLELIRLKHESMFRDRLQRAAVLISRIG